jgi:FSR family fosmidomycin resistance protein-like MFS transporter
VFLLIEFLDELASGARETAWPVMRQELGLTYLQIGLLLGIPSLVSGLFEPVLGILADARRRRAMVIAGGVLFGISLAMTAASPGFWLLLLSFVLFYPASGAFVTLSQAELMDREPDRRDKNMAMWTFAGSAGSAVGPLALVAASRLGFGWRGLYLAIGAITVGVLLLAIRHAFPRAVVAGAGEAADEDPPLGFREGVHAALKALRRGEVIRWLVLLELANLMLDVFFGYLALYFVDVASVSVEQAAVGVVVWTVSEIAGDLVLIPLLDRIDGLVYLRISAGLVGAAFPCFLLIGPYAWKLALIAVIGLLRAGWYAILQARFYAALPGQSGIAVAISNLAGSAGGLIPLCLGAVAEAAGLQAAMWLLMAAPLALIVGLPRKRSGG